MLIELSTIRVQDTEDTNFDTLFVCLLQDSVGDECKIKD